MCINWWTDKMWYSMSTADLKCSKMETFWVLRVLTKFQIPKHLPSASSLCKYSKICKTLKSGALWIPSISNKRSEFSYSLIQNWGLCFVVIVEIVAVSRHAWSLQFSCLNLLKEYKCEPLPSAGMKQYIHQALTEWKTQNVLSVDYLYKVLRKCISRDKTY